MNQSSTRILRAETLILSFLLSACGPSSPPQVPPEIFRFCESESGLSRLYVHLDLANYQGKLRYNFLGQDILYQASDLRVEGAVIEGLASFDRSATGEVRAQPFSFVYDHVDATLRDGVVLYRCSPLQDPFLVDLGP